MFKGFKEFILRGNVIDLAVAVVIGAAFTAIVTAIVDGFINPLIAMFFNAESLADASFTVGSTVFGWGMVLAAVINFLAVAFVVYFAIVVPANKLAAMRAKPEEEEEDAGPSEQELLSEIRDLLKANAGR